MKFKIWSALIFLMASKIFAGSGDPGLALRHLPVMTEIPEADPAVVLTGRKTLYIHGLKGHQGTAAQLKREYGSGRLPGSVVSFDLPAEAAVWHASKYARGLGRWPDVLATLHVLNQLRQDGEEAIGITAHSRGGAAAINTVRVLANQSDYYTSELAELGIYEEQRTAILKMLQAGQMVLECPLIDTQPPKFKTIASGDSETEERAKPTLWQKLLAPRVRAPIAPPPTPLGELVPSPSAGYEELAKQACASVLFWNKVNIPVCVHFQAEDEAIGTKQNAKFFAGIYQHNGERSFIHTGNDGGHFSSLRSFEATRNAFLRDHGAAYKPQDVERK